MFNFKFVNTQIVSICANLFLICFSFVSHLTLIDLMYCTRKDSSCHFLSLVVGGNKKNFLWRTHMNNGMIRYICMKTVY